VTKLRNWSENVRRLAIAYSNWLQGAPKFLASELSRAITAEQFLSGYLRKYF